MSAPAEVEPVQVPDDPYVWLAIFAEAYTVADRALWRFKDSITAGVIDPTETHQLHLETLREKRREAYQTLAAQVYTCEAIRLGAKP